MTTTIIVGAGIVGLHMANATRELGHDVYVLDAAPYLGEHTSGRNSGVIHAGIFYQPGSFKERMCLEGNRLTYEWLKKLNVDHRACGKFVIPEPGQEDDFEPFFEKVNRLPIPKPVIKSKDKMAREEPALRRTRAIFIPATGIMDAGGYVKNLAAYLEQKQVVIVLNCRVTGVRENKLITNRDNIPYDLAINCAGLFADEIAQMTGLTEYTIRPNRGDYFVMNTCPVNRPVYHLPYQSAQGLGVHLTPTLDNQLLVGPNHFFIKEKQDYEPHSEIAAFKKAVTFYLPAIKDPHLTVAYAGNRPKLYRNGKPLPEFTFVKKNNWIHLLGIESPGLTAAPALAKHLKTLL